MIICKPKLILKHDRFHRNAYDTFWFYTVCMYFCRLYKSYISLSTCQPTPSPLSFSFFHFSLSQRHPCSCVFVVGYKYCTSIYDLLILNAIQGHVWWRKTQGLCIISVPAAPFTFTSTVTCFVLLWISQHARAFCDTMATVL